MSILRVIFCIKDENEMLMATLDMWKFRVVTDTYSTSFFISSHQKHVFKS